MEQSAAKAEDGLKGSSIVGPLVSIKITLFFPKNKATTALQLSVKERLIVWTLRALDANKVRSYDMAHTTVVVRRKL